LDVVQEETTAVTTAEAQRKPRDAETATAMQRPCTFYGLNSGLGELLIGETASIAPLRVSRFLCASAVIQLRE